MAGKPKKREGTAEFKNGVWQAKVWLLDDTRKRIRLPETITTREKAKTMAKVIQEKISSGQIVFDGHSLEPSTDKESFSSYTARWVQARQAKGLSSAKDDASRLRDHVIPVLGSKPIADITQADIKGLVRILDQKAGHEDIKFSWKTAQNVWVVLRGVFKSAHMSKDPAMVVRSDDPTHGVLPPDTGLRRERTYLYPSEFQQLIACSEVPVSWRRLYALAAYTMSRAGELRSLTWDAVDMDRGVIHFRQASDRNQRGKAKSTKSGKNRRIPIEPNLRPLLECLYQESNGQGKVIHVPISKVADTLQKHLRLAGLTRSELFPPLPDQPDTWAAITFHDLRGTGVTWAALRGDEPLVIQQRAGHSDFTTTQRYLREAETLGKDSGKPFPPLSEELVQVSLSSVPVLVDASLTPENHFQIAERDTGLEPNWQHKNSAFQGVFEGTSTPSGPCNSLKVGNLSPWGHQPTQNIRDRFMRHLGEVIGEATRVGDIHLARVASDALDALLGEENSPALSLVEGGGQ